MNELKELLTSNWTNFFTIILCLFILWDKLTSFKDKVIKRYGIKTTEDTEAEMLHSHDAQINSLDAKLTCINDKINVMSQMIIELEKIVSKNYEDNRKEHENFRQEKRKDQLSIIGDRLFQAYNFYKKRAEQTGAYEWTCVEKSGFYTIMDNYHDNGGDTYSHSTIEPYMRQFIVIDPENANPNDIYFDR